MLSSIPTRLIARRSRSLSPCSRVLKTSAGGAACRGVRETPAEINRNPIVSTSRVSRRGILAEETAAVAVSPSVQYHHLAPRWLSNLENRRGSWAALASRGRNNNQYWEESSGRGGGGGQRTGGGASRAGGASVGVLSAAAVAFCLKKDSDNKGDALLEAARTNNSQDVARLVKEGVDPNHRHRLGWTALMVAVMNRQHRCAPGEMRSSEVQRLGQVVRDMDGQFGSGVYYSPGQTEVSISCLPSGPGWETNTGPQQQRQSPGGQPRHEREGEVYPPQHPTSCHYFELSIQEPDGG